VRLFVALDLPEGVRAALSELAARLKKSCNGPRWVLLEGVHVTLKFIGETSDEQAERIRSALAQVRVAEPVEMRFSGLGFFPNEQRPRVFWAGMEAEPTLAALASAIETKLEPLGIPRETHEFHPHITLARLNSMDGVSALQAAAKESAALEFGHAAATEFFLYRSVLKSSGAEYTRLASYPFTGDPRS
jgi:RNA 2',3'-cyclic 3'-phosphodiesterase